MSSGSSPSSSSSGSDSEGGGHPMDAAVRRRHQPAPAAKSSSPESGEVPGSGGKAEDAAGGRKRKQPSSRSPSSSSPADLDAELAAASGSSSEDGSDGSGSGSGSDDDEQQTGAAAPVEQAVPAGVVLVDSVADRNAEVARLLRAPRYFDEDFEQAGLRCFKCGGKGHFARDCSAAPRERSCFLCAQFGHDSRDCPNSLCWRCQRAGHMARDCPYGHRQAGSWDEAGPPVCLRCGSETCPCAGEKDFVRAGGGCQREYSARDLQHVRCYACGKRGHVSCADAPTEPAKLSCHNCGQGGHTAAECSREVPQVIRGEQMGGGRPFNDRGSYGGGGGGGWGGGSRGSYGGGGGQSRFERYEPDRSQYGGRRYSDPGGLDYERGAKRPRW